MQGSDLIYIVLPIVIPVVLFIGVALPFLADSRGGRGYPARGAMRQRAGGGMPVSYQSERHEPSRDGTGDGHEQ
jgi:hypothetical protein